MTFCRISLLPRDPDNSSMPPIIHHRLKSLELDQSVIWGVAPDLLGSLTLPCLQEVEIFEIIHLIQLSALVRRSSCPLTKLTFGLYLEQVEYSFDELQPLPGVTDLVVKYWVYDKGDAMIRLLLEGYFPDLRHLTLGLRPFDMLWNIGAIPLLLNRKRPRPDEPNGGRLHKFIVVGRCRFDRMWNSVDWESLRELGIAMREDGFEFF